MPLPATPWLNTPDWGNIYLGGMGAGSTAAANYLRDLEAQRQVAAQQAIASQQVNARMAEAQMGMQEAQMRDATQRELAEKQLLMDQHRLAVEDQYRQATQGLEFQRFGVEKERFGLAKKLDEAKLAEYADQAAAMMEADKRIKAGEDKQKVWAELGPRAFRSAAGLSALFQQPTAPARTYLPPEVDIQVKSLTRQREEAAKTIRESTDEKIKANAQIEYNNLDSRINALLGGKKDTVGEYVRGEGGQMVYVPGAASMGQAMQNWGGQVGPLMSPGGTPAVMPQAQLPYFQPGILPPATAPAIPAGGNVPTGRYRAFGPYF